MFHSQHISGKSTFSNYRLGDHLRVNFFGVDFSDLNVFRVIICKNNSGFEYAVSVFADLVYYLPIFSDQFFPLNVEAN